MEELLSLKWNNHRSTFIHVLGILRDKQLYTDATLACDGKFYSVHKLVLSTCSDYFSAMLDRTNCKNPVIVLKDIKCEDLEALLDYMYLGEVNVRQSDLATLIKAAECLRVKGLAVPDDEPPVTKKRETQPSRRNDTSSSPPAKRKRRSDVVDDGRDDVRPARADHRQSSPARSSSRPKSPASSSTPLSPVNHRSTPQKQQPSDPAVASSPKTSTCQPGEEGGASGEAVHSSDTSNNQAYATSEQTEPFVKVEMDDGGSADLESYDLSNDGAFKEEDDGGGSTAGDGGDLSNDLPEFLQQAASGPMAGGAFGHSSFSGSSSFQPGDLAGWQGDGSNVGFPHLNFSSAESASQQNAPGTSPSLPTIVAARSALPATTSHHRVGASTGRFRSLGKNRAGTSDASDELEYSVFSHGARSCATASTVQGTCRTVTTQICLPLSNCSSREVLTCERGSIQSGMSTESISLVKASSTRTLVETKSARSFRSRLITDPSGVSLGKPVDSVNDEDQNEISLNPEPECSNDASNYSSIKVTAVPSSYPPGVSSSLDDNSFLAVYPSSSQALNENLACDEAAKTAFPPLFCPVCGRAVYGRNRRQNMENHMLTHSNVRPHKCSLCSYSSIQLGNLRRHMRNVHKVIKSEAESLSVGSINIWPDSYSTSADDDRPEELPSFLDSIDEDLLEFPHSDSNK